MGFYEKEMKRLGTTNDFISRHLISSGFGFSVITIFSNLLEILQTPFDATEKILSLLEVVAVSTLM